MPNKDLKDKMFNVPDKVFNRVKQMLTKIEISNKHAKGVQRAKDIIDDRMISYSQMKRLKNFFDSYEGDGNDAEFNLIGGKVTKQWIDDTLGQNRESIKKLKKAKMDGGLENQFLKTHEKDFDNANPTAGADSGMIDVTKGSTMRNVMTGDAIYKSSDRKTEAYNKEIESIKYLIEYMSKK